MPQLLPTYTFCQHTTADAKFFILLDVSQARNVKKMDKYSESDAYIVAQVGDQKKKTKYFNNSANPVWNSSFKFHSVEQPKELTLTCMDYDPIVPDDHVGTVHIDLSNKWDVPEQKWEWVSMHYVDVEKGTKEETAQVQIRVLCLTVDPRVAKEIAHYDYSHLLEINLLEGSHLAKSDKGRNEYFCIVSFGSKNFKTRVIKTKDDEVEWNQKVYFWANVMSQATYKVKIAVYDRDSLTNDDVIGATYIDAANLFDNEGKVFEEERELRFDDIDTDKELDSRTFQSSRVVRYLLRDCLRLLFFFFSRSICSLFGVPTLLSLCHLSSMHIDPRPPSHVTSLCINSCTQRGNISYTAKMVPKEQVQEEFFEKFLSEFDANDDDRIQREEVGPETLFFFFFFFFFCSLESFFFLFKYPLPVLFFPPSVAQFPIVCFTLLPLVSHTDPLHITSARL